MNRSTERWLEDPGLSVEIRELLSSDASPTKLPVSVRQAVGSALMGMAAGSAAGAGSSSGVAVAGKAAGVGTTLQTGAGMLVAAALGAAAVYYGASVRPTKPPAVYATHPARPIARVAGAPASTAAPAISPEELPRGPSPAPKRALRAPRARPSGAVEPVKPGGSVLAEETMLLEKARRELRSDPVAAQRWLEQHERQFPNGSLVEERRLLQVRAALGQGERNRAAHEASRWRAQAPDSVLARQAEQLVNQSAQSGEAGRSPATIRE
jgi:hypothetical protein